LSDLKEYIDSTYDEHYSTNQFQATEFIIDGGHGEGFCIGNIMKYAQRYGKKDGYNKRDLMKILHYTIIAIHNHDIMEKSENETK
jgi:hypothetical protein